MSSTTTSIFKALSLGGADTGVISLPSIFTPNSKTSLSYLSIPPKPIKLHLSCSHSSTLFPPSFSLSKNTLSFVSSVAQEDSTLILQEEEDQLEELKWENEDSDGAMESGFMVEEEEQGADYLAPPPEEVKIFIGNLPYDVDVNQLAEIFNEAGTVETAEVIHNRETGQSRGFGFVTMSTVEEAERAVEMFHRYDINGRFLTVNKAAPRGSQPERPPREFQPAFRIYVGNLPWEVDSTRLEQIFSKHGKVVQARIVFERESGRSRGFGFVTMATESEMRVAIDALDGESLEGRAIRVSMAQERPRRSNF